MAKEIELAPWQAATIHNPYMHFAMLGGVATGKTYTGAHFAIDMLEKYPDITGFIGANTYDQMSQATLREFFYWLDEYNFEFMHDKKPPEGWGIPKLKSYKNTVTVLNPDTGKGTLIFTRVLAKGSPLRGMEFSWYWIDESRDTPQNTHDVILSRMRESEVMKGLVTTTTNGEDWAFQRFVKGRSTGNLLYGSLHVPTEASVKCGIITDAYYQSLLQSYSPLMAAQELFAEHVNVLGGRAYYAADKRNQVRIAPWGDREPDRSRPLVVGCDFNFSPAPCIWMVGQTGPDISSGEGTYYSEHIHWYDEIVLTEASTVEMTETLIARYPDFFFRVFGDSSGNKGTTSNAGEHDYNQMAQTFADHQQQFSIDVEQSNPLVKNRIENMNRLCRSYAGTCRQTYNPDACPNFDTDLRIVGWKAHPISGKGHLDGKGDANRTHASDGAGYAVYKMFPPGRQMEIIESVPSAVRADVY